MLRAIAAVALALAGGLTVREADAIRATPRAPPGPASVLGGLSALAVQISWIRADDALRRGDHAEGLLHLDLIHTLEPHLVAGAGSIAHRIGVEVAGETPDPETRWGLVREGLAVLDRTVAQNPGLAEALTTRGTYTLQRFTLPPARIARFTREIGHSPYEAALEDFRTAVALEPEDLGALDGLGAAALYAGRDQFIAGEPETAAERLAEAIHAFRVSLDIYRAGGLEEMDSKQWALAATEGLHHVCTVAAVDRATVYRRYWDRFGGPQGLPGLPPPAPR